MKFIKHKFQSGDGFIGTKEERIILQKLIVEKPGANLSNSFFV